MIIRAPGLGDALDDILNGSDGGSSDSSSGSSDGSSWWDKLNQTADTKGANSVISGVFSLFGGKTNTGTAASYPKGYTAASAFPWGYVAAGAGVLAVGYLVLHKR